MFGREPRLPTDFLLGRVHDPVPGPGELVEHKNKADSDSENRLELAFYQAHEQLRMAVERCKDCYDSSTLEVSLSVGQLVNLRHHTGRGCHKIQDHWISVDYKVLKAPSAGGAVYTIALTYDSHRTRTVHWDLLKAWISPEVVPAIPHFQTPSPSSDPDKSLVEVWMQVWDTPAPLRSFQA